MTFVPPPHTPYQWQNAPATSTPLDAAHLEAAETDLVTYAQQVVAAYDTYAQGQFIAQPNAIGPAARAYRGAGLGMSQGFSKIPLDTVTFDTGSNFDVTTNHRYNVTSNGIYFITANYHVNAENQPQQFNCCVYKNGSLFGTGDIITIDTPTASDPFGLNYVDLVNLVAGDYLELWGYQGGTNVCQLDVGSDSNYLSVIKMINL